MSIVKIGTVFAVYMLLSLAGYGIFTRNGQGEKDRFYSYLWELGPRGLIGLARGTPAANIRTPFFLIRTLQAFYQTQLSFI